MRLRWLAVVTALVAGCGWLAWTSPAGEQVIRLALDLRVYRHATQAMLDGTGLYEFAIPDPSGPATFLYPPFAALLVVPTLVIPEGVFVIGWLLAQLLLTVALVAALWRRSGRNLRTSNLAGMLAVFAVVAGVVVSEPVLSGLVFGQVSLVVTALVILDVLVVPPRWRGILIGVAAAIKLTPLFMVAWFVVTGQWRQARTVLLTFTCAAAAAFVILPAESWQYWTRVLFDGTRVPSLDAQRNLSLLGALRFWGVPDGWVTPVWLALGAVVGVVALWRARRHFVRGELVASLLVAGAASALLSPVSWSHFLVWLPLVAVHLVFTVDRRLQLAGWLALAAMVTTSPVWPHTATEPWAVAAGSLPTALLAVIACFGVPQPCRQRVTPPTIQSEPVAA